MTRGQLRSNFLHLLCAKHIQDVSLNVRVTRCGQHKLLLAARNEKEMVGGKKYKKAAVSESTSFQFDGSKIF